MNSHTPKPKNLILLHRREHPSNNLFLVHDRSGDIVGYIEFCRHLTASFNCWGIQAERLENFAPVDVVIGDLAADYLKKIKQVQSEGPYYIAAWSFGAEVAFEMARLLEQNGEAVAFLAFIDAPGPGDGGRTDVPEFSLESEMALIKKYFRGMGLDKKLESVTGLKDFWPLVVKELEARRFHPEYLRRIVMDFDRNAVPVSPGLRIPQLVHYWNINRSFLSARRRYVPSGKLETQLYFYRAMRSRIDHRGQWDGYCVQPVTYRDVPGNHLSIFRQPLVRDFARMFSGDTGQGIKFPAPRLINGSR